MKQKCPAQQGAGRKRRILNDLSLLCFWLSVAILTKKKSRDHEKYRKGVGRNEVGEDLGRAAAACVSDAEGIRRADEH